jgi:hypothetical protein
MVSSPLFVGCVNNTVSPATSRFTSSGFTPICCNKSLAAPDTPGTRPSPPPRTTAHGAFIADPVATPVDNDGDDRRARASLDAFDSDVSAAVDVTDDVPAAVDATDDMIGGAFDDVVAARVGAVGVDTGEEAGRARTESIPRSIADARAFVACRKRRSTRTQNARGRAASAHDDDVRAP